MDEAEHILEIQKAFMKGDFPIDMLKKEYKRHYGILRNMKVDMSVESEFRYQAIYAVILRRKIKRLEPNINFGELHK